MSLIADNFIEVVKYLPIIDLWHMLFVSKTCYTVSISHIKKNMLCSEIELDDIRVICNGADDYGSIIIIRKQISFQYDTILNGGLLTMFMQLNTTKEHIKYACGLMQVQGIDGGIKSTAMPREVTHVSRDYYYANISNIIIPEALEDPSNPDIIILSDEYAKRNIAKNKNGLQPYTVTMNTKRLLIPVWSLHKYGYIVDATARYMIMKFGDADTMAIVSSRSTIAVTKDRRYRRHNNHGYKSTEDNYKCYKDIRHGHPEWLPFTELYNIDYSKSVVYNQSRGVYELIDHVYGVISTAKVLYNR